MAKKSKLNIKVFLRLLSYWKSYKTLFFLAVVTTFLLAFPGPLRPYFIGEMVQKYIVETQNPDMLLFWTFVVVVLLMAEAGLRFLSAYFSNLFAQSIIRDVRKSLLKHILTFRIKFFDKTPVGTLITRVVSDLEAITEVFSSGMIAIAGELVMLFVTIGMMFYTNWVLTLLVLIPIPLLLYATRLFARVIRKSYQSEAIQVNKLNVFVQERITGMSLVQLFSRQKQEFEQFKEINKGHRQAHIKAVWATSIFFPVVESLSSISIALLLVWGALQVEGKTSEEISGQFGEIVAFILWVHMLYRPIRMLADKFNILQKGTVRAERVFAVIDLQDNIQNNGELTECDFNREIKFENLYFAYTDEDWVLKNVNLTIEPGSTVAFVGATGAGKSSLVNLLGRFYEYQKGDIFFGDKKLIDIELNYLRKNIAIVLQDVFLFSGSIMYNITLGDKSISKDQVIEASKAVGAHTFIEKLPNTYDYEVGERGGVLSTGQRQLISFIRAYVYDPHILILDEATSSVDNESEELIQNATLELTKGRTSIVIAHRLSTIKNADKIVVLDKGEIIEQGAHEDLMKLQGYYYTLHEKQFS